MIADDELQPATRKSQRVRRQDVKVIRKKREPRQYVSKHFTQSKSTLVDLPKRRRKKAEDSLLEKQSHQHESSTQEDDEVAEGTESAKTTLPVATSPVPQPSSARTSPPPLTATSHEGAPIIPRVYFGLNVDELSSDSDLTDVPDDIGPDPFLQAKSKIRAVKTKTKKSKKVKSSSTKSPYFPQPAHSSRPYFLTTLPFPPLSRPTFGLMQERLAHNPYQLLLATIFLNRTPGIRAMPIFYEMMKRYPTPLDLSTANQADLTDLIRVLGFQNQRARKCIAFAQTWLHRPPQAGVRYRKLNYPCKGDGKDIKEGEAIIDDKSTEEDPRVAWEISHLPGLGPYSHDSWRMFCRDELRGKATDWLGNGAASPSNKKSGKQGKEEPFEPEWKRVLPMDKELRAWMTWMWLKEGWLWNKETGQKTKADDELMELARGGGVVQEPQGSDHLIVKKLDESLVKTDDDGEDQGKTKIDGVLVEKPAGDFMPG